MAHTDSIPDLIHRLRGGGGGRMAQTQAARQLLNKAECCWMCCAQMMAAGAPQALVALLLQPNSLPAAKQWAARTLGVLTAEGDSSRCEALAAAGAVPALLQCLVSDSPAEVQAAAATTLADMTGSPAPDVSLSVDAAGGVQLLVPLLSSPQQRTRHSAAAALRNIAADCEECRAALAASALPVLVQLLRDDDPVTRADSAHLLTRIAEDCEGRSAAIVEQGALPHLLRLLSRGNRDKQQAAAGAVHALTLDGQAAAVAGAGAVGRLVRALRCADDDGLLADAALALLELLLRHAECCVDAVAAIPPLVSMLASDDQLARGNAAAALACIVADSTEAASTAVEHGAVPALVQAMQRDVNDVLLLQEAALALSRLAAVPGASQQLEAAGGVPLLIWLLGTDDDTTLQEMAAWAVRAFALTIAAPLVAAGAIRALLSALQHGRDEADTELQKAAAVALGQLAAGSMEHCRFLVSSGGIATLRPLLGEEATRSPAAWALRQLAAVEPAALEGVPDASDSESESSWDEGYSSGSENWHTGSESGQPGPELEAPDQQPQHGQQQERHCAVCGATRAAGVKLRLCAGCRTPGTYFCSDECQRQFWPSHRAACRAAAAAAAAAARAEK